MGVTSLLPSQPMVQQLNLEPCWVVKVREVAHILNLARVYDAETTVRKLFTGKFDVGHGQRDLPVGILRRWLIRLCDLFKRQSRFTISSEPLYLPEGSCPIHLYKMQSVPQCPGNGT